MKNTFQIFKKIFKKSKIKNFQKNFQNHKIKKFSKIPVIYLTHDQKLVM